MNNTTPPKKKAAKPRAITVDFLAEQSEAPILGNVLHVFGARQLKEHLRDRGLPIPKAKSEMVARLVAHIIEKPVGLKLTIG